LFFNAPRRIVNDAVHDVEFLAVRVCEPKDEIVLEEFRLHETIIIVDAEDR